MCFLYFPTQLQQNINWSKGLWEDRAAGTHFHRSLMESTFTIPIIEFLQNGHKCCVPPGSRVHVKIFCEFMLQLHCSSICVSSLPSHCGHRQWSTEHGWWQHSIATWGMHAKSKKQKELPLDDSNAWSVTLEKDVDEPKEQHTVTYTIWDQL